MINERPVIVLQVPAKLVRAKAHLFFAEIEVFLKADRPRLVFDFSGVTHLDSAGVEVLLNSMEEVMKRNGDLKLASLPPSAAEVLELTRVDHLFEAFDQASDAVESFHHFTALPLPVVSPWSAATTSEGGSPV